MTDGWIIALVAAGGRSRLRQIEQWVLEEKGKNLLTRRMRHRIVAVWNLVFGIVAPPVDADDFTIPISNCDWLLRLVKRELERDAERRR